MSLTDHTVPSLVGVSSAHGDARAALKAFWARAELSKLKAKFAVAQEMDILPRLSIQALRAIALQYRYFTQAFVTDLALLVARCPEGGLRSLIGQLVDEELGQGDPEEAHLRLYDCFLESIGAIEPGTSSDELSARAHPRVRELLAELRDHTVNKSTFYAIGLRGMGGECVCGVYFSVMHVHLRKHPFIVEHETKIDWRFWDIHAGNADVEHNERVRTAVAEFLLDSKHPYAVNEVSAGYESGTAIWDEFWSTLYGDHIQRSA